MKKESTESIPLLNMHEIVFEYQMINKYQQEMKKEAEVETFSNGSLFVLLKVLIVISIGQNLMIIFIFYHKF